MFITLMHTFIGKGFRIVKPGEEDGERYDGTDEGECESCGGLGCEDCNGTGLESTRQFILNREDEEHSMYLKDDPEALKKALAYHRRNVAELSRKSFADLTDEEYDSLKHSEGELELNEGEEDNEHTFGNIQFEPLGKNHNGAEAFRVYKDGSYVLYATMYGPRNTVTLLADPKEYAGPAAAHLYPASPNDSLALTQFDKKQIPGGLEKVAARLGASEEDNEGMSNLEALISSANEDGELKLDDETAAAEFEINKTQY
jgi:hypothetical protein